MHRLATDAPEVRNRTAQLHGKPELLRKQAHRRSWMRIILNMLALVVMVCAALFVSRWPFTRSKVIADLEGAMQGRVEIGKFQQTWFPPGCVAENVTFTGYGNLPNSTPITVRKLTIQSSFRGLFNKHLSLLQAEGVHVVALNPGFFSGWKREPSSSNTNSSKVTVEKYVAVDWLLEFLRGTGDQSLQFAISRLEMSAPDAHQVMTFQVTVRNPEPQGEVQASGYLGPWKTGNPGRTPIAGSYSFRRADLGVFHGIGGTLSSQGSFQGTLAEIEVRGKTTTPDFEVTDAGHRIPLVTEFQARVHTNRGDTLLELVHARLGRSGIEAEGDIKQNDDRKGKFTAVNLLVRNGRIQDFLFLFLKDRTAPMTGRFDFRGVAVLPPGQGPFDKKIELQGDFGVGGSRLSNPATQTNLDQLSQRAEGIKDDPPESVLSDLKGHVVLRQGIATFSNLSFRVPGAVAKLHGTYSLITHQIDLRGNVFMEANLPQATKGVESFFLKIINPFLKKNRHGGAVVPVTVTGIYPHPVYKTDPI